MQYEFPSFVNGHMHIHTYVYEYRVMLIQIRGGNWVKPFGVPLWLEKIKWFV